MEKMIKKFIKKALPIRFRAFFRALIDFHFHYSPKGCYAEGFNNQIKRQEIFQDIQKNVLLNAIVETGTFQGSTTEFFLKRTNIPVYSVELMPRYYYYSYFRLRKYKNIHLFLGDSVFFLKRLQEKQEIPKKGIFFYLDAHWGEYCPLRDEIDIITKEFSETIIMIDNFQVPDDSGYSFDDYGAGDKLCLEYIELNNRPTLTAFFPVARSSEDTGARCGCIILVTKDSMLEHIKTLKTLRQYLPS